MKIYDKIIIGGGLYGLYAAWFSARALNESVLVLERDAASFMRATYINQARVHMGYHYPRSLATAVKSKKYFDRFNEDFGFCIHESFNQIYATSKEFSWANAKQFQKFCVDADIFCQPVMKENYFKQGMCDGAFLTKEYTYDAHLLRDYFIKELLKFPKVNLQYEADIISISEKYTHFIVECVDGEKYSSAFLLNATYASINQIHKLLGYTPFNIKYELCEIILTKASEKLKNIGITVMDGPFFSIMPFGKTNLHSLTSVTFTPHDTNFDDLPTFSCQKKSGEYCTATKLGNCNECIVKPRTEYSYMANLARKYLLNEFSFTYQNSLFSIKPILVASEIDDSRPTVIRKFKIAPTFISVLSGKINTVYDLEEMLK
ncbi:MAG: FAD-dependent oxidoreductase [Lactobacillales bacterium]|jgi:glycine/D-amino acid oxidase-like deaminating enzyme|nr:FAD-dependent oxidoreductase [Lactobacillales bacterium]